MLTPPHPEWSCGNCPRSHWGSDRGVPQDCLASTNLAKFPFLEFYGFSENRLTIKLINLRAAGLHVPIKPGEMASSPSFSCSHRVSGGIRTSAREGQAQASRNQGLTDILFWAHAGKGALETAGEAGFGQSNWRLPVRDDSGLGQLRPG